MTSAAETFVVELARSASQRSHRLLRGLSKEDADDVLSTALLWCWETRDAHDPATEDLEEWFIRALKKARREYRSDNRSSRAKPLLDSISIQDDTLVQASAASTADVLERALNPQELTVLRVMDANNWSFHKAVRVCGLSSYEGEILRMQLKKIKDELPTLREWRKPMLRRVIDSDDLKQGEQSPIDKEISQLDFPPEQGKDCPPCWKCRWYDGWTPVRYRPTRLADAEVQAAVQRTEAEKIRIADSVSNHDRGY